jgi:hypothetical protein
VHVTLATLGRPQRKIRSSQRRKSNKASKLSSLPGQGLTMLLTLLCFILLQVAAPLTSPFAIFMGTLGLLVSIGAGTFFVKYGTRLAIVEKESSETKQKVDSQAKDLAANSQQTALVAAALSEIRNALNELKTDVKEWMRSHDSHNAV